mmetsp:Transcript_40159/g.66651  ORF Transcript_40159/g.66651 Transcript_40159/m.66651 type:complete len:329 (-) Transcript_40159:466-1452(-)
MRHHVGMPRGALWRVAYAAAPRSGASHAGRVLRAEQGGSCARGAAERRSASGRPYSALHLWDRWVQAHLRERIGYCCCRIASGADRRRAACILQTHHYPPAVARAWRDATGSDPQHTRQLAGFSYPICDRSVHVFRSDHRHVRKVSSGGPCNSARLVGCGARLSVWRELRSFNAAERGPRRTISAALCFRLHGADLVPLDLRSQPRSFWGAIDARYLRRRRRANFRQALSHVEDYTQAGCCHSAAFHQHDEQLGGQTAQEHHGGWHHAFAHMDDLVCHRRYVRDLWCGHPFVPRVRVALRLLARFLAQAFCFLVRSLVEYRAACASFC